jgi:hypothetical protein
MVSSGFYTAVRGSRAIVVAFMARLGAQATGRISFE